MSTSSTNPGEATKLASLTVHLTAARFGAKQGETLLYFAGILAYGVTAALALTVAGGTWMFHRRAAYPSGLHAEVVAVDPSFVPVLGIYFWLAVIACALLIPAAVNLAAGAAVLGARGRERRLAALRLLGLSSGEVVRMSLLDGLIQSVIGGFFGSVIYLITLPLWGYLTMEAMPIRPGEMLLPAWLFIAVLVAITIVGMFATWRGLRQVSISPLGVARRANKPTLSWVRAVLFLALIGSAIIVVNMVGPSTKIVAYVIIGVVLLAVVVGIAVFAPWLLQMLARLAAQLPWPAMKWAARRIIADPGATWRRVSGMALLSFIAGYLAMMPIVFASPSGKAAAVRTFFQGAQYDFVKGVLITIAVGFVLTATSMLIAQASATIERAEQSQALRHMGAPASFSLKAAWLETFGPFAIGVMLSWALGVAMALPMAAFASKMGGEMPTSPVVVVTSVILAGLLLAAGSMLANYPLYYRLLGVNRRRND